MGINEALDNLYVCAINAKSETLEEGYYEKCYDRVIEELNQKDKVEADLYEANNRIVDYMDIIEERDRMIDWLVEEIHSIINLGEFIDNNINKLDTKEQIKEYFEKRCKNAKD